MKKQMTGVLIAAMLAGGVFTASAQTATTTSTTALQALIESLQQQVLKLTAQIAALQQVQTSAATATTTPDIADLIANLKEGSSGEGVKMLQALLAADSKIYPEGKITGIFGRLTANAIKRYQKDHGIKQSAKIDQKTIEELKKESESTQVKLEDRNGEKVPCAIVPPGHTIAPGWLRKNAVEDRPIVPACQTLPRGIEQKGDGEGEDQIPTSTDMIAPIISQVISTGVTSSNAQITWSTNESATSMVWYSASTPVTTANALSAAAEGLREDHSVTVSGLASSTTYYYVVVSADEQGNTSTSSQYSFATLAQPTVVSPIISQVTSGAIATSSAQIAWLTTVPATSMVQYSTSTPVTASAALTVSDNALVASHSMAISGLTSGTTYYYLAASSDATGNTTTSTESSFQTATSTMSSNY